MSSKGQIEKDKNIEQTRYNEFSSRRLNQKELDRELLVYGAKVFPEYLRTPYIFYENLLSSLVRKDDLVLELCCGDGIHTVALANTGSNIISTDIAEQSIVLAKQRAKLLNLSNIIFEVADVEALNFQPNSFDFVTCVGSLSYLNLEIFLEATYSVLKPNGKLIILDSFNHNPIYKLNRYIHYLTKKRSLSTLKRMPTSKTLRYIGENYSSVEVNYFGVFSFFGKIVSKIFGPRKSKKFIDYLDKKFYFLHKLAFKIVIVATK